MPRQVTLNDIARETSLSVTAVWRSLADDPQIPDATRSRVRDVSKRLNYRPRTYRRSQRRRPSTAALPALERIALVQVDAHRQPEEVTSLLAICQDVETRAKVEATVIRPDADAEAARAQLETAARDVDAVLLSGYVTPELFAAAAALKVPAVAMGQVMDDPDVPVDVGHQMSFDFSAMARLATRSLWAAEHRRIGFMCEAVATNLWTDRWRAGYRQAMFDLSGAVDADLIQVPGYMPNAPGFAARKFAALDEPPTAMVFPDASLAARLIPELKASGIELAHDAVVIGSTNRLAERYGMQDRPLILIDVDHYVLACLRTLRMLVAGYPVPPGRHLLPFTPQNLPAPIERILERQFPED